MNRVIALDLLRFLAALSVVLYHYTFAGYKSHMTTMDLQEIGFLFQYGHLGVELFFMISGFVILLSAENKTVSHFVVSRISRLYPAYWAGVSMTTIVIVLFGAGAFDVSLSQYLFNMTMIQEFFAVRNIDGVYWTLFVELRFYLLIFLLLFFKQIKFLKYYLLGWSILSLSYWFFPINAYLNYYLISNVAPFFIAGSVFYMAYKNKKFTYLDYLILLLSFVSAFMYVEQKLLRMGQAYEHSFSVSIAMAIIILYYLIFFIVSKRAFSIEKDKKIFMMMGAVTYPLYLVHQDIGFIIFNHLDGTVNKYILLVATILLMLLLSYAIHMTVEKKVGRKMKTRMFRFVDGVMLRIKR